MMSEANTTGGQTDGPGLVGCLFGIPVELDSAEVVLIPVPWEVTVSYGGGASGGPQAILDASPQLDTHLPRLEEALKPRIAMEPIPADWLARSEALRSRVAPWIGWLEEGHSPSVASAEQLGLLAEVEGACEELNDWVAARAAQHLAHGRIVGVVGGDHSTPLGLIQALAQREAAFGILQIDAHADLRVAYEGFPYSHASIMTNALKLPQVKRLVQVGLRDTCAQEEAVIADSGGRIMAYHAETLRAAQFDGESWANQCERIVAALPGKVYISFDIDGLDPSLCPSTGTPVPDGLRFEEAAFLLRKVRASGREVLGFDLCEVARGKGDWDGSVGARLLYRLAVYAGYKGPFPR
jgi:agmatinase